MSNFLDEIISSNQKFIQEDYPVLSKIPAKHLAIIACMDTRLIDFLEPALGIKRGDAHILKSAGNTITGEFDTIIKSLLISIYEMQVRHVIVIGHHQCGMQPSSAAGLISKMREAGVCEAEIERIRPELEDWLDNFATVEHNVSEVVQKISQSPLIPSYVEITGAIICPDTGKLELI